MMDGKHGVQIIPIIAFLKNESLTTCSNLRVQIIPIIAFLKNNIDIDYDEIQFK